jgi:hypothetical protein
MMLMISNTIREFMESILLFFNIMEAIAAAGTKMIAPTILPLTDGRKIKVRRRRTSRQIDMVYAAFLSVNIKFRLRSIHILLSPFND